MTPNDAAFDDAEEQLEESAGVDATKLTAADVKAEVEKLSNEDATKLARELSDLVRATGESKTLVRLVVGRAIDFLVARVT